MCHLREWGMMWLQTLLQPGNDCKIGIDLVILRFCKIICHRNVIMVCYDGYG